LSTETSAAIHLDEQRAAPDYSRKSSRSYGECAGTVNVEEQKDDNRRIPDTTT
jgi:hypothetical protein